MTGNNIADEIMEVSRASSQNSLESVESETKNTGFDKEITKEWYIFPERRQKIIDNLRLIQ